MWYILEEKQRIPEKIEHVQTFKMRKEGLNWWHKIFADKKVKQLQIMTIFVIENRVFLQCRNI